MSKSAEKELGQLKTAVSYLAGVLHEGSLVEKYDGDTREEIAEVLRLLLAKVAALPENTPANLVQATAIRAIVGAAEIRMDGESASQRASRQAKMQTATVTASLGGHSLGEWSSTAEADLEYVARCQDCRGVVYVSHSQVYSLLEDPCAGVAHAAQSEKR